MRCQSAIILGSLTCSALELQQAWPQEVVGAGAGGVCPARTKAIGMVNSSQLGHPGPADAPSEIQREEPCLSRGP